ncbi:hypothetical protein ABFS83_06G152200 [Erythranthe nasuta]
MESSSSGSAEATPPWLNLPREITAAILQKLRTVEILTTAQKVCTTWRSVCNDPSMWRRVDIHGSEDTWEMPLDLDKICRHAVDRSSGQLIDISIEYFGNDDLLLYISRRSSQLKRLQLVHCYGISYDCLIEAIKNLPLLEELHLYYIHTIPETIASIGRCCPLLKSFTLNTRRYKHVVCDLEALAIAENMPGLVHLQLFGNRMTNEGLNAILEGCPNLESLDLRYCFNLRLFEDLGKLCSKRIKDLKLPHDSIDDYKFPDTEITSDEPSDDDYVSGFSNYEDYFEFLGGEYDSEDGVWY